MKKIGVIFGGMSTENEVSIKSAKSVLKNLDKGLYEIYPIYIDKEGKWWKCSYNEKNGQIKYNEEIENVFKYLKEIDVAFPVLHGLYGEDGTIQGLFELLKIPYVGCHVLASSVGMDKAYTVPFKVKLSWLFSSVSQKNSVSKAKIKADFKRLRIICIISFYINSHSVRHGLSNIIWWQFSQCHSAINAFWLFLRKRRIFCIAEILAYGI